MYRFIKAPGSDAGYTVTLKTRNKWESGTSNTLYIKITGPYSSYSEASMDGIGRNEESVYIKSDVGLPSCVTVRNSGDNAVLIEWVSRNI